MFIGRNQSGEIYGVWTSKQPNDADHPRMEEVADDDPELRAFLAPKPVAPDPIDELRAAMKADPTLLDKLKAVK